MTGRLEGKVVFITGVARGQGRSHAIRFAQEGADVIGIDLCRDMEGVDYPLANPSDLKETVEAVEALDRRIVVGEADVRDRESMRVVLDAGMAELGRLDFVIANAGIMPVFGEKAKELQAWHDTLDVMLTGPMHTVELTYPHLVEQGRGGSIAITSSMAGLNNPMMRTEGAHTYGLLGYAAAKAALVNLARNYASILARHNIRVNTVHPTGVNTPMINNDMMAEHFGSANPEDLQTLVNAILVPAVEPVDISNVMLWLCSDESRYYTGNAVRLDAGADLR